MNLDQSALREGANEIRIHKTGTGRLYWSASGAYYSNDKKLVQNNKLSANDNGIDVGQGAEFAGGVPTKGVQVQNNQITNSLYIGVLAQSDSTLNVFQSNKASGTAAGTAHYDCQDLSSGTGTAGTADTWKDDQGMTASPAAICKRG